MNFRRKFVNTKLLAVVILALALSPVSVFAQNHTQSVELEDLLPQYNNFKWIYHGSVEYGHDMEIESIVTDQNTANYFIEGNVHDASGGESDSDYSLGLEYTVHSDVIIQTKTEEMMLDSDYDEIELIRTPLEEGSSWTQEVENSEGETTLESTITEVEDTDDGMIFTVRYEDLNSDYYEEREIQEGVGVITFTKLMITEDDSYPMGYSLFEEGSGVELGIDFHDVSGEEWYIDHVSKLVTLDLIEGYPDGSFRADGEITVAEFIKITVESMSYYQEAESGIWYEPYVSKAIELELIEDDEFEDYNRPITREEMTKIIVMATGEEPQSGQLSFTDAAEIDAEFVPYVYTAVQLGIIEGYPSDNTFRADRTSTRAEASKLFVILVEEMIHAEEFNEEDALALEAEFENRLYQETEADSWVVRDFDNKEDLIDYISEIADRELVSTYVDNYYDYMDGELVLPPKDGITTIIEDREYQLEMIHPREYQMTQETTTEMVGHYTITITYRYENDGWIMQDRDLEVH
ncbi:S-layer homology domain-containing protein [Gudongella sp. DL1XJH-153]|uniref:S-layer homology domain-containing protein n=1 Tax=Gudongella sp. DL1XJH-153 TaxID=3409804 RepID=UPI003BB59F4F